MWCVYCNWQPALSNSFLAIFYLGVFVSVSSFDPLHIQILLLCVTHIRKWHLEYIRNRILCIHISVAAPNQIRIVYIEMAIGESWKQPLKLALHDEWMNVLCHMPQSMNSSSYNWIGSFKLSIYHCCLIFIWWSFRNCNFNMHFPNWILHFLYCNLPKSIFEESKHL